MLNLSVGGVPKGKDSSNPCADKIRLILPQGSVLSILDAIFSERLNKHLDIIFPLDTRTGMYRGGVKRTQCLDIAHSLQLCVEKGLDSMSRVCVAQEDIKQYFDCLPLDELASWLERNGFPVADVACILRHQLPVTIYISLAHTATTPCIVGRAIGGLTGSRVALSLSRIPIGTLFAYFQNDWLQKGFQGRFSAASWIDNIYFVSSTPHKAITMATEASNFLKDHWGLDIKSDSTSYMCARGHPEDFEDHEIPIGWSKTTSFNVLGHVVQNTGASCACVNNAINAAWRVFWANIHCKRARNLATMHKLRMFDRFVTPVLRFRWSRWPFNKSLADRLDRTQCKMYRSVFKLVRLPLETDATFFRRSAKYVASL